MTKLVGLAPPMKLVYDVNSVPEQLGIANMIKIFEQHNVVFYNSDKGLKPQLFAGNDDQNQKPLIVDTKGAEVDFEQYEREFNDKVFWDKELYNCQHSPIYYWNNYGTPVYPSTVEGTQKYLSGIGLKDVSVTDSAKAKKAWDKQKEKVAEAMSSIKMEHLKERKAALDTLRAEYETSVTALEKLVSDRVDLFNAKGEPHAPKKRISNLVGRIRQTQPIPEKWKMYRNKKRKWDGPMLFNTNYNKLLEMYNDLHPNTTKYKYIDVDGQPAKLEGTSVDIK